MRSSTRSLTLLELLVVVAILATLAGAALLASEGVEGRARAELEGVELSRLRAAVLRFRSDTGYLPKQGPYALVGAGGEVATPAGADAAEFEAWFHSPANLSQLYENPLAGTSQPREWDPDRRRGWRGPYLGRAGLEVSVGDGLRPDGRAAGGPDQPSEGGRLLWVPALPDAFPRAPLQAALGPVFAWRGGAERNGRPLLLLSLDDPNLARVVSCGADGRYAPLPAGESGPVAAGSDDQGAFLLR